MDANGNIVIRPNWLKKSLFLIVSLTYLFQFYIFKLEKPRKCLLIGNISRGGACLWDTKSYTGNGMKKKDPSRLISIYIVCRYIRGREVSAFETHFK